MATESLTIGLVFMSVAAVYNIAFETLKNVQDPAKAAMAEKK
jgi:hypothetical protein